ncbi:hypothetical protein ATCC90586_003367 [Pythium insidiosum]|nr:hypothetical protein ATCC90586_003367 [Pythium insidiosum]
MGNTCSSERAVATTKHTTTNARVLSADTNGNERILVTGASGQLGRATLRHLLETLRWYSAAKDGKTSAISRDDLALAAAHALVSSKAGSESKVYELTGPEALTAHELVAQVSKALNKPIEVVSVSPEDLAKGITAATGWPEAVTTILASFDVNAAAGFAGDVTDDFFQLTGQRPQSFATWMQQHKTQFLA